MTAGGAGGVLVRLVHSVDRLDWRGARETFADELTVDYTSLSGGEVERLPADDLLSRWRELLPGFDATQHLLGPVRVTAGADEARVDAHVRGYHHLAGPTGVQCGSSPATT